MTRFYLIRHATNDLVGRSIAGWSPNVHLNEQGRHEAEQLALSLARSGIDHLYSSPLERAQETAAPLAAKLDLEVQTAAEIGEIRFGHWTGKAFDSLTLDPTWQLWNTFRSGARAPGGESMLELQARFVEFMEMLRRDIPGATVALISHGDPIRSALLYYLGMPLDAYHRMEISPASVSIIDIADTGPRVMTLNREVADL